MLLCISESRSVSDAFIPTDLSSAPLETRATPRPSPTPHPPPSDHPPPPLFFLIARLFDPAFARLLSAHRSVTSDQQPLSQVGECEDRAAALHRVSAPWLNLVMPVEFTFRGLWQTPSRCLELLFCSKKPVCRI